MSKARTKPGRIVSELAGRPCQHCEDGELAEGTHKDSLAAICTSCEVPQVRFA